MTVFVTLVTVSFVTFAVAVPVLDNPTFPNPFKVPTHCLNLLLAAYASAWILVGNAALGFNIYGYGRTAFRTMTAHAVAAA